MRRRGPSTSRTRRRGDAGTTLVEMVTAMGLFSLMLALVMTVVIGIGKETVTTTNTADNATQLRRAYTLLDDQTRSALAVNAATASNGSWYLEMLRDSPEPGGLWTCLQWRLRSDGTLSYRTYRFLFFDGVTPTSGWIPVASELFVPPATGTPPLQRRPADAVYGRQRLDVKLESRRGDTRSAQVVTSFVVRDSTTQTPTDEVCAQFGRP